MEFIISSEGFSKHNSNSELASCGSASSHQTYWNSVQNYWQSVRCHNKIYEATQSDILCRLLMSLTRKLCKTKKCIVYIGNGTQQKMCEKSTCVEC